MYFPPGISSLNYDALLKLNDNAISRESSFQESELFIACDTGLTSNFDQRIGLRRALTARSYLMALGFDSTNITISFSIANQDGHFIKCLDLDSTNYGKMKRPYSEASEISFVGEEIQR
ncbi:MAG TPA: hypothetical protein DCX14_14060 [Flavobacteriales bacterium]|nr:hypothetical protein [Flavobacteriales bacterium]